MRFLYYLTPIDIIGHSWQAGPESGSKSIHCPTSSAKACFMVAGDITTSLDKGRRVGPMSGPLN